MEVSGMNLTLGPEDGTRIIFETRTTSIDWNEVTKIVQDPRVVWEYGEDGIKIVGRGEQGTLRVIEGKSGPISLMEGLRRIETYEASREGMSGMAAIFAAILAAAQGLSEGTKRAVSAPAFFAHIAEERGESEGTHWNETDIVKKVGCFIDELVTGRRLSKPTAGPLDSARFWLKVGEILWEPGVRARLSGLYFDETIRHILIMLSGAWMDLKPEGWVKVAGISFCLRRASKRWAWQQVLEWEAGGIKRSALKYLTAYQTRYSFEAMMSELMGHHAGCQKENGIDVIKAAKESRWLLEETALNWTCDPRGSFRVDIPDRTPLKRWGVSSLRVWILPRSGLWIALERDEKPGVSFQWTEKPPHLRRWVIQEEAIPNIHLTVSALWRDLKVGGREVILPDETMAATKGERIAKKIRFHGRIRWGSDEELERIMREAYPVEQHIRVLPQGKRASRRAFRRAMAMGIRLKPGTTLVRNHKRGKPDDDVERVPVKAQGLARLILASKGFSTMKEHVLE
jgi:hypothetical protein